MKKSYHLVFSVVLFFIGFNSTIQAQTLEEFKAQQQAEQKQFKEDYTKGFEQFVKERDEAIKKMDEEFKEFLKKEWTNYELFKAAELNPKPKPKTEPIYKNTGDKTDKQLDVEVEKTPEKDNIPTLPVLAKSIPDNFVGRTINISFYGAKLSIDYDSKFITVFPTTINEETIADQWEKMSETNYATLILQLNDYKTQMNLNDWGYYLLIKNTTKQITKDKNAQTFLNWFLLTKANYKTRLAFKNSNLYLLLPTINEIYEKPFYTFDNQKYYLMEGKEKDLFTYDRDFPEARTVMDLNLYKSISTNSQIKTKNVKFTFNDKEYAFDVKYNQNAINFYNDYPLANIEVYFDATISQQTKESLADGLLPIIKEMSNTEAVNLLLKFVQTAFNYQTDQGQFGKEKFFFPEELFYYKASDCEDRAVLFSYLVREFLKLDVIGLNYPGHMATAVKFKKKDNATGDFVVYKGEKYVICDPTYVNAPLGLTMPQFADVKAKVVKLNVSQQFINDSRKYWALANKKGLYQGGNEQNIIFDKDGNAYLCGYFSGSVDFFGHKLSSVNNTNDMFIAKISKNGVDFIEKIGGAGNDIAYGIELGNDNSFYVTGSFSEKIKIAGKILTPKNTDVLVAKYSLEGQVRWANQTNIEQLDSSINMFVSNFNPNGKRTWIRAYNESENFTNYGITVNNANEVFVTASLKKYAGMDINKKSYESYTAFDPIETLKKENDNLIVKKYDSGIAGLFAVLYMIDNSGISLPGNQAQKALDKHNPSFKKNSPVIYNSIGRIEFIKNSQGIVSIRTDDGKEVYFDAVKVENNSKIKVSMYNSGNAQIDILSGVSVGKSIIWYDLNFIRLYKSNGDLLFDYDSDHTQKRVNIKKDILN
jgi:hypothetical protein